MKAKTPGSCYICESKYEVGDDISWARRGEKAGLVYHEACKNVASVSEEIPMMESEEVEIMKKIPDLKPTDVLFYEMAQQVIPYVCNLLTPTVIDQKTNEIIAAQVGGKVDRYLEKKGITTIRVERANGHHDISGLHHKMYEKVIKLAETDNLWLWGPSGSGKSEMFFNWVKHMGFEGYGFLRLDPATPPSHLVGYQTANGVYIETQFYRCLKNGWPFFIDEVCGGAEALLASLNTIYSNGWASFPDGKEPFEIHPDHRLWVADNTPGRGATTTYHARRPQDGSFIDRFTFVHVPIDEKLEQAITDSIATGESVEAAVRWIRSAREYVEANQIPKLLATPRSAFKAAQHLKNGVFESWEDLFESVVFRGFDADAKQRMLEHVPYPTDSMTCATAPTTRIEEEGSSV